MKGGSSGWWPVGQLLWGLSDSEQSESYEWNAGSLGTRQTV